ncbi:Transglutaminase-like superfamily protein [Nonomuraea coxensis DSM 45129]|uniref:Transglutaminase-like superfamily protein n=1 Tax=Nonomuraea coxensis DSM 45129 TaxID=1122611 RepID=A0ABX8U390_9ACTN|nr:transglutaminase family protein [Nonomuraea coxensis]QYC41219.1 Transglutaminase-like superfamily protein [Nonomuraea coxensis DSM 45129]
MGWRLKVSHVTHVEYDGEAHSSYNEVRMTPAHNVLSSRVTVTPSVPVFTFEDYWGTTVTSFDVMEPHTSLTVEAVSRVETSGPARPRRAATGPDPSHQELLRGTPMTAVGPELAELARIQTLGRDPHETAGAICEMVAARVACLPDPPGVRTSAQEAWDLGKGACQDMAHLTAGLLRAAGLPARYVSGYLHPRPTAEVGEPVEGRSHAWVEYWAGEWLPLDPAGRTSVGEAHVVVARGRDYSDVPPLKGVHRGPAGSRQEVRVTLTRLATV